MLPLEILHEILKIHNLLGDCGGCRYGLQYCLVDDAPEGGGAADGSDE